MKAGIFVDAENVMRNGGWGLRYDVLRNTVKAQGTEIVRANIYMAYDPVKEDADRVYWQKKEDYRAQLRRCGFKVLLKEIKRYTSEEGELVQKGNTELDLAIDALLQAKCLDYIVLVTGDGDLTRLVSVLQDQGMRVDVISFHHTSHELREMADYHCYGFLIPNLLPIEENRRRGVLCTVDEHRYFGHISTLRSYQTFDENVFCHGSAFEEERLSNKEFAVLKEKQAILEFETYWSDRGPQAKNVTIVRPTHLGDPEDDPEALDEDEDLLYGFEDDPEEEDEFTHRDPGD